MSKNEDASELGALARLVEIAHGDSGQCARVANFLLAWWDAGRCGGFDLTDLWNVDAAIADDMIMVMRLVCLSRGYPDAFGYGDDFEQLVASWRPQLLAQ